MDEYDAMSDEWLGTLRMRLEAERAALDARLLGIQNVQVRRQHLATLSAKGGE